jgi:hypothetical protein
MTYVQSGLIQAADFNNFNGNVQSVWLTSYGQTSGASNVAQQGTVSYTNWQTLNTTVSSIAAHQGWTPASRVTPTAGNVITILNNLGNDVANCVANVANAASQGSQFTSWTGTASQTNSTGTAKNPWTITFTDTITFANTTAANTFFNAGGTVKIQFSKSSTGSFADAYWNTLASTTCGTVYLSGTGTSKTIGGTTYTGTTVIGGAGTPSIKATTIGYQQLTGSQQTLYKQFDSTYLYGANYIQCNAAISGAVLTLTTTWVDAAQYVDYGATTTISGGTVLPAGSTALGSYTAPTTLVTAYYPESTNLTTSPVPWGTITIASTVA